MTCSRPSRWTCGSRPPFEPARRDGKLFARGVSDDKGHLASRLFAIDALLRATGELPVQRQVHGRGRRGSQQPALERLRARHTRAAGGRRLHLGVRRGRSPRDARCSIWACAGSATWNSRSRRPTCDAHSGLGGRIFPNAAWRLVWALTAERPGRAHPHPRLLRRRHAAQPSATVS